MNQEGYIKAFHAWVRRNEPRLNENGITVQVPEKIIQSGTHADFFSETVEATVEVWDYGFSEFHVADLRSIDQNPDYQVKVTHHEFQSEDELVAALEDLLEWMSQAGREKVADKALAVAGQV